MSETVNEWVKRLGEIAANFIVPGLGGLIFAKGSRRNALCQVLLSLGGLLLALAGAVVFLSVFVDSSGAHLNEEYVAEVARNSAQLWQLAAGLGLIILGGVLVMGGFLWSLDNAMRRWRVIPKSRPEQEAGDRQEEEAGRK